MTSKSKSAAVGLRNFQSIKNSLKPGDAYISVNWVIIGSGNGLCLFGALPSPESVLALIGPQENRLQ